MALKIRKVLVAVRDPAHASRGMLRKAGMLASAAGASIEVYHAVNEPLATDAMRRGKARRTPEQEMSEIAERARRRLERLAKAIPTGVRVRIHAEWDYPPHEAIVRRTLATGADLVIAAAQPRRFAGRLILANTDWELIRHCPAPLLLIKSPRAYDRPVVLASVDPFHAHAKPAALDARLLDAGAALAQSLGGELHAFHAYMPLASTVPTPMSQPMPVWLPPEAEKQHARRIQSAFDHLAKEAGVGPSRRHLRLGDVPSQLQAVVKRTGARIVVMGAVSRSGLRRIFIGSTAERVLDQIACDVLIVKPRGFVTSVPKRVSLSAAAAAY